MFAKRLIIVLAALAIAQCRAATCYAESSTILYQAYAWEQYVDMYFAGDMDSVNLSCKVSNQTAEIIGSSLLANGDITIRTTILLDISGSMPMAVRENVKSLIDKLIQNKAASEQYRLAVFGEQLIILQDFTSDRYDLSNAATKIVFNGQESKIYDAIYNTIPVV